MEGKIKKIINDVFSNIVAIMLLDTIRTIASFIIIVVTALLVYIRGIPDVMYNRWILAVLLLVFIGVDFLWTKRLIDSNHNKNALVNIVSIAVIGVFSYLLIANVFSLCVLYLVIAIFLLHLIVIAFYLSGFSRKNLNKIWSASLILGVFVIPFVLNPAWCPGHRKGLHVVVVYSGHGDNNTVRDIQESLGKFRDISFSVIPENYASKYKSLVGVRWQNKWYESILWVSYDLDRKLTEVKVQPKELDVVGGEEGNICNVPLEVGNSAVSSYIRGISSAIYGVLAYARGQCISSQRYFQDMLLVGSGGEVSYIFKHCPSISYYLLSLAYGHECHNYVDMNVFDTSLSSTPIITNVAYRNLSKYFDDIRCKDLQYQNHREHDLRFKRCLLIGQVLLETAIAKKDGDKAEQIAEFIDSVCDNNSHEDICEVLALDTATQLVMNAQSGDRQSAQNAIHILEHRCRKFSTPRTCLLLGQAYIAAQQFEKAVHVLEKVCGHNESPPRTLGNLWRNRTPAWATSRIVAYQACYWGAAAALNWKNEEKKNWFEDRIKDFHHRALRLPMQLLSPPPVVKRDFIVSDKPITVTVQLLYFGGHRIHAEILGEDLRYVYGACNLVPEKEEGGTLVLYSANCEIDHSIWDRSRVKGGVKSIEIEPAKLRLVISIDNKWKLSGIVPLAIQPTSYSGIITLVAPPPDPYYGGNYRVRVRVNVRDREGNLGIYPGFSFIAEDFDLYACYGSKTGRYNPIKLYRDPAMINVYEDTQGWTPEEEGDYTLFVVARKSSNKDACDNTNGLFRSPEHSFRVILTPTGALPPSPTRTPTSTATPTSTWTVTPTNTPTPTPTPTPTSTWTATPTPTATWTPTPTNTPTPTATWTPTPTNTPTPWCHSDYIILSPKPGEIVSGKVEIIGTTKVPNFQYYKLEYVRLPDTADLYMGRDGTQPTPTPLPDKQWHVIVDHVTTPREKGTLAEWDTTIIDKKTRERIIPDGIYEIRLTVVYSTPTGTQYGTRCRVRVKVENE